MYCTKKEKVANDCLVICIGIASYTKESGIPNCENVAHDITTYTKAFRASSNYTVISNDVDKVYSKRALISYLSQCFSRNVYNSSTGKINYNALMITISAHCTDNSVICSTGEKLHLTQILSIFTNKFANRSLVLNLPKFIIVDGQRGFNYLSRPHLMDDKKDDIAYIEAQMGGEIMDTYSAIMCSVSASPESPAYGGQLCWNLAHIFSQNMQLKRDIIFHDVLKELRQRLHTAVLDNFQFSVDFIEHDMDIDDVVFIAPEETEQQHRGTRFTRSKSLSLMSFKRKKNKKKPARINTKLTKEKKSARTPKILQRKRANTRRFAPRKTLYKNGERSPYVERDPLFKDAMEWDKTLEILSETKDKTRVKVEWLFILNDEAHSVCLVHSQKADPYTKAKKVLFIDGKQIWNQKSTATQFTQRFEEKLFTLAIDYNADEHVYDYRLKINNKTHKEQFHRWFANVLSNTFLD